MAYLLALYQAGIVTCLITFTIPSVHAMLSLISDAKTTQIGSTVTFRCYGPAVNQRGISFFQNGGKLVWKADGNMIGSSSILEGRTFVQSWVASGNNRYSSSVNIQENHYTTTLTFALQIDNISVDDSKRYSCALLSDQNVVEVESNLVRLSVHFLPNELHPLCTVDSVSSDSNHATLKCRSETAVPAVHLKWISSRVSDDSTNSVSFSNHKGFSEADLDIPIIPFTDVNFTCVMNYTGNFEQRIRKCTLYTPKISLDPYHQEVLEGDDAEFKCSVSAKPKPTTDVQWSSFPALNGTNSTSFLSNSISTLTVRNVTMENNGTQITCRSQNTIGVNQGMAYLLVKTPTKPNLEIVRVMVTPQNITVKAGKTAVVECQAIINKTTSRSNVTPKPKYSWYYEDQEISASEVSERFSIEKFPFQRLYLRNVDIRENNATISCVVNVDGSEKRAQARLIVNQEKSQTYLEPELISSGTNHRPDVWKFIIPISAGLVSLALIVLMFIIFYKAKRKCAVSKNQHRVHGINDSVRYNTSLGTVCAPSFNNGSCNNTVTSHAYSGSPKVENHERLMVNLPPIPPIPETIPDGDNMESWRVAKKLEELQDYEDMETVRSNFYHMHENNEHGNEYQSMIHRLERANSQQNTPVDGKKGIPEPLY